MNETISQWLVWQLADSAFPSGGFAHSSGLEAAWREGLVNDGPSIAAFVRTSLRQCERGLVGFVRATWSDPENFIEADQACDLFINNHVANRASRSQGRAFLTSVSRIFPAASLSNLLATARRQQTPTHLAPVFGLACASIGLSEVQTIDLFLFILLRGCVSAAVRLGIIGPIEAQQIQSQITFDRELPNETAFQTAPLLDLLQATQDRLYSKLFQS